MGSEMCIRDSPRRARLVEKICRDIEGLPLSTPVEDHRAAMVAYTNATAKGQHTQHTPPNTGQDLLLGLLKKVQKRRAELGDPLRVVVVAGGGDEELRRFFGRRAAVARVHSGVGPF